MVERPCIKLDGGLSVKSGSMPTASEDLRGVQSNLPYRHMTRATISTTKLIAALDSVKSPCRNSNIGSKAFSVVDRHTGRLGYAVAGNRQSAGHTGYHYDGAGGYTVSDQLILHHGSVPNRADYAD
jgi:hypothetical protein